MRFYVSLKTEKRQQTMIFVIFWLEIFLTVAFSHDIISSPSSPSSPPPSKVYVFYFPQFHEDKLNNKLWGIKGYSDWNNLNNTKGSNNLGDSLLHPHATIGYYDLTTYPIRRYQREISQSYGVDGFLIHHYWFYHKHNNNATLAAPLFKLLLDGEPNISFAFNWAFDSWYGTWHGRGVTGALLHKQHCPSKNDSRIDSHYHNFLKHFFHHPNYIKIHSAPLLSFLRSTWKNNDGMCWHVFDRLKELAQLDGFPTLYIIGGEYGIDTHELYTGRPSDPHYDYLDGEFYYPFARLKSVHAKIPERCSRNHQLTANDKKKNNMNKDNKDYLPNRYTRPQYVSTLTTFDNTPRRDFKDSTIWNRKFSALSPPNSFGRDLLTMMMYERCCQDPIIRSKGGEFIAVNAWNEWGEGMALEPSKEYDFQFLEALQEAKNISAQIECSWEQYYHILQTQYCEMNTTCTMS